MQLTDVNIKLQITCTACICILHRYKHCPIHLPPHSLSLPAMHADFVLLIFILRTKYFYNHQNTPGIRNNFIVDEH